MSDLRQTISTTLHRSGCYASDHTVNRLIEALDVTLANAYNEGAEAQGRWTRIAERERDAARSCVAMMWGGGWGVWSPPEGPWLWVKKGRTQPMTPEEQAVMSR